MLHCRQQSISIIIPLFRVIQHSLSQVSGDTLLDDINYRIREGLEARMNEKRDARGNIKMQAWHNNKELVLSTLLDSRFKFSAYLDTERHDEYRNMLVIEVEKMSQLENDEIDDASKDMFAEFEEAAKAQNFYIPVPLLSPHLLDARQKADFEVNDYLSEAKLKHKDDPYIYWTGNNAAKWPLLTKLALKLHSAPPTSAESERIFSTAGLIVNDLRKRLTPEHVDKLLFLHHNLKIYNLD